MIDSRTRPTPAQVSAPERPDAPDSRCPLGARSHSVRSGRPRLAVLPLAALLTGALSLSGCSYIPWLNQDKDPTPPTPLAPLAATAGAATLWSVSATRGTGGRQLYLAPALSGDRLHVADARGRVAAVDRASGRILWQRELGLAFSGGPAASGDRLALGTSRGELALLSAQDGAELWRVPLGSEVLSIPRLTDDGKVIVHTLDDSVHALDAASGALLWRAAWPAPALTLRGSGSPVPVADGLLVGLSGGRLVKLDPAKGAPLWETLITRPRGRSELARITDIDADPVVVGDRVYVGSYNGDLAAVDLATGSVLWRREVSAHAGLSLTDDALFITASDDRVLGASPVDGAGRWQQDELRYRRLTAPVPVGGYLAVGDLEGYLHLLDPADGRLAGRVRVAKAALRARPLADGNRLYVLADDGTLAALSIGAGRADSAAPNRAPPPARED